MSSRFQGKNLSLIRPVFETRSQMFAHGIFRHVKPLLRIRFFGAHHVVEESFLPVRGWNIHFTKSLGKRVLQALHPIRKQRKRAVTDRRYNAPICLSRSGDGERSLSCIAGRRAAKAERAGASESIPLGFANGLEIHCAEGYDSIGNTQTDAAIPSLFEN